MIERRLQDLKDQAYRISPVYSPTPKGGTAGSKIENAVTRIADMENQLILDRLQLIDLLEQLGKMCAMVDDRYRRNIMTEACLVGHTIATVAENNNLSERQVYRILWKCYNEISRKMSLNVTP